MSIFKTSTTYVPTYPDIVELTVLHEKAHWGEWEVKLQQDVEQWKRGDISDEEKKFINTILRLFTQSDVEVGKDYYDNLIPVIRNNECRNMLGSFASREGTHQRGYALISDTLGFGEDFYLEFLEYKEMQDKVEFMRDMDNSSPEAVAISLVKQMLIEGVCLFASFAMLLNFTREGKMLGMGDINLWSIKDESMHVAGLSRLFHYLVDEHPEVVTDAFKKEVYGLAREVVGLEDKFIDLAFDSVTVNGITKESVKDYIRAVTDYRMMQIGFKPQYNVKNPFEWLDWVTSNETQENFFEVNTINYSKDSTVGDYSAAY